MKKLLLIFITLTLLLILSGCTRILFGIFSRSFKDTESQSGIKSKYNAENKIYFTNRIFFYKTTAVNSDNDTLINEYLILKVIPGHWFKQTKIKWKYFKTINDTSCYYSEITGLKEDPESIWFHPPRANNYGKITEAIPFPMVSLPVKIVTKKPAGSFYIGSGWPDELKGKYIQIYSCYETEIMETKLGELSVNKIEIEEHKSDNNKIFSTALLYFNEKYGIIKFDGISFDKTHFNLTLENVIN